MANHSIEISVRGKWITVPALRTDGKDIVVNGKWLKVASVHDEAWLDTELDDPQLAAERLKEQTSGALRADLFTFTQLPSSTKSRYEYAKDLDSIAAIQFDTFKKWWEGLPQESRKNVRRSQKRGVEVRVVPFGDELIAGIADVNNDSPVRQREPNVHYGKSTDQVRKDQSSFLDRSDFICAYLGAEMIGFVKLVYRGRVASILSFVPKTSHADKRPANAMIAKAVELCECRGISCLTYGMFSYGNKRESPLLAFKIRNGFTEVLVPRYYIPLTRWGAFCLKAGLHRGLLGMLPQEMISLGVRVKEKWYALRMSSAGVA